MNATVDLQAAHGEQQIPAEAQFCSWVEAALKAEHLEQAELTIRTVSVEESQQLNRDYRGKDKPTNVLSFPFDNDIPLPVPLLGDLVICVPVLAAEAEEQNKALHDHWAHLVVHGTLHLLGYDHIEDHEADIMESLEIEILHSLGIDDPYRKEPT
ncbi:rRNA maturation RNase YbeY [Aliidiomarina minuta]|uniref:Endoribonuclease YbeY n=1 Tax=Aliidiomarina minuta TaxID=880057 RepID=A0A432W5E3_9GAMM|nr:rRNA maturation RNase YbeY [Aliidiomarina minuta]RUO25288.1 rRNA maturation RNase YbeY [Aliidiomarina minuta]